MHFYGAGPALKLCETLLYSQLKHYTCISMINFVLQNFFFFFVLLLQEKSRQWTSTIVCTISLRFLNFGYLQPLFF